MTKRRMHLIARGDNNPVGYRSKTLCGRTGKLNAGNTTRIDERVTCEVCRREMAQMELPLW